MYVHMHHKNKYICYTQLLSIICDTCTYILNSMQLADAVLKVM